MVIFLKGGYTVIMMWTSLLVIENCNGLGVVNIVWTESLLFSQCERTVFALYFLHDCLVQLVQKASVLRL